jgi:hypothetical protein
MASIPTSTLAPPTPQPAVERQQAAEATALVPSEADQRQDSNRKFDGPISRLPVELDVAVPIRDFRIRNLIALEPGLVVASQWGQSDDLPVMSGNQPLAWSEFEVVDTHLAVRLTRLP